MPLVLKSVPCTIDHWTFCHETFGSPGESIQTKSPDPGHTAGYSRCITGGAIALTFAVADTVAGHPFASVTVTETVIGPAPLAV